MALWPAAVLAVVVTVLVFVYYQRRFVTLENRCDESWANVDTELKRRHDLIPNLVAAVKGYAKHERGLMDSIAKARVGAINAEGVRSRRQAEQALVGRLNRLLAVAEAYPDLKASDQFLKLQHELAITEDRIQAARRFYNANVRDHRNLLRQFPGTLFGRIYGVQMIPFFRADHVTVPGVQFA